MDRLNTRIDVTLFEDLRWRLTKSRDMREPNLAELFFTGAGGGTINDPAFGGAVNNSLTILPSPNLGLQTEQGDTITTGFVYQPSFAAWIDGVQLAMIFSPPRTHSPVVWSDEILSPIRFSRS